jgi:methylmalonyl-CoA/ethylmalonyl-CoA epimerase
MDHGPIYIDHIGIATKDLETGSRFWRLLGLGQPHEDETVESQGVTTRFFATSPPTEGGRPSLIELLEPTAEDTPVGRFLEKRGEGIQQLCFSVGNLQGLLDHLDAHGIRLINRKPTLGAGGKQIAFVHPASTGGVLVELTQRV